MSNSRKRFAPFPEGTLDRQRHRHSQHVLSDRAYRRNWSDAHHAIFRVGTGPDDTVCPPEQVFKSGYVFLFQMGGASFTTAEEYSTFINCFRSAGDEAFAIVEQPGIIRVPGTDNEHEQDKLRFDVGTPFETYAVAEHALSRHYPFGLGIGHYCIFGRSAKWGLYLAECPTLLIIGAKPDYATIFREELGIEDNGFDESMHDFVKEECGTNGYELFVNNYLADERYPDE
jgi:hypothetical protein